MYTYPHLCWHVGVMIVTIRMIGIISTDTEGAVVPAGSKGGTDYTIHVVLIVMIRVGLMGGE